MTLTVAVVGATGYLGRALCATLAASGRNLLPVPRTTAGSLPESVLDIIPEAATVAAVVNVAGCYGRRGEPLRALVDANALLPLDLFEACRRRGIPQLIHVDTVLPPGLDAYSSTKAMGSSLLALAGAATPGPAVTRVRCHQLYGPQAPHDQFPGWLLQQLTGGADDIELTEGSQRRDFLYLSDAVAALGRLLEQPPAAACRDVELGSGEAHSIRYFSERMKALSGSQASLRFGARASRTGEPECLVADIGALKSLGWMPRTSLDQGLRKMIEERG